MGEGEFSYEKFIHFSDIFIFRDQAIETEQTWSGISFSGFDYTFLQTLEYDLFIQFKLEICPTPVDLFGSSLNAWSLICNFQSKIILHLSICNNHSPFEKGQGIVI